MASPSFCCSRLRWRFYTRDVEAMTQNNMALIRELRGEREAAVRSLSTAESLGYQQTSIDEIANKAGSILATIEGRKKK